MMEEVRERLSNIELEMAKMTSLMQSEFHGPENKPGRIYDQFDIHNKKLDKIERTLNGDDDTPGLVGKVQVLWRIKNWLIGVVAGMVTTILGWLLSNHGSN